MAAVVQSDAEAAANARKAHEEEFDRKMRERLQKARRVAARALEQKAVVQTQEMERLSLHHCSGPVAVDESSSPAMPTGGGSASSPTAAIGRAPTKLDE
eukprot:5710741-Prymnesium_polylepis.1